MKYKKLGIMLLAGLLLARYPVMMAMALDDNSELNESYIYTPFHSAVQSPAAYLHERVLDQVGIQAQAAISPTDVFAREGGEYLYIVCGKTNAVYVVDRDFTLVNTIAGLKGEAVGGLSLNAPEGVFVDAQGDIYIADTGNQRIVYVKPDGTIIKEYGNPGIKVMGQEVSFFPSKVVVDDAKRMYVVGKNINRGVIELSQQGEFNTFIGAPKVKAGFSDYVRRLFMSDEQIRRMEKFVPTEYNNLTLDPSGFLYGSIGSVDAEAIGTASRSKADATPDNAKPVVKLSPAGKDVLMRRGNVPIIGELNFNYGDHSYIVDTAVRSDGIYSILDQRHGRVFSYDMYGNLLYVFGSLGKQDGRFQSPSALCYFGDNLVVADQLSGRITVFKSTEYGAMLMEAVRLDYDGRFDEAAGLWVNLSKKNSNLFLSYTGIGKMYYRDKDYKNAMKYFKAAYDYYYYDKSKEKLRKELITEYFTEIFLAAVFCTALLILRGFVKKRGGMKKYVIHIKAKKHMERT